MAQYIDKAAVVAEIKKLKKRFTNPHNNVIIPIVSTASSRVLAFPTAEMRDEFLETFHDLIEEAKPLL